MEQNPPLHLKTLMTLMTNDLRDTSPCEKPFGEGLTIFNDKKLGWCFAGSFSFITFAGWKVEQKHT